MADPVELGGVLCIECFWGEFRAFELQKAFHGWVAISISRVLQREAQSRIRSCKACCPDLPNLGKGAAVHATRSSHLNCHSQLYVNVLQLWDAYAWTISGNVILPQNPQVAISEAWMVPNLKWGNHQKQVTPRVLEISLKIISLRHNRLGEAENVITVPEQAWGRSVTTLMHQNRLGGGWK